jgi:hypothetical protein
MNKNIDSVRMMRDIRDKLSQIYTDPEVEKKDLEYIRKKYKIDNKNLPKKFQNIKVGNKAS